MQNALSQLGMHHFPSTKQHRSLDLVPFFEMPVSLLHFEVKIVLVYPGAEADLADYHSALVLACLTLFLRLLLLETPIIQQSTHRRNRGRRNLHQVGILLPCRTQGFLHRHNAELFAIVTYDTNLTCSDLFVYAKILGDKILPILRY